MICIVRLFVWHRMNKAIRNGNYELAESTAIFCQDMAFKYYLKGKAIPEWIKDTLRAFNNRFGWMKIKEE